MNRTRTKFERVRDTHRPRAVGVVLLLLLAWLPAQNASAASMADGNATARVGDFTAALEAYDAARRDSGDSALLAFNTGVAQFRLRMYQQAEASFAKASQSQRLAPRAFYNLGLVLRAQGREREAATWFQQAASHPASSAKLRALARTAAQASATTGSLARRVPVEFGRDPEQAIDFFDFGAAMQMGSDSNVYRSPNGSYVDLSAPGTPTVDPDVQSASYVPVQAWASANWGRRAYSRFHLGYAFDGEFYTDPNFSNANRYAHVLRLGNTLNRDTRWGRLYLSSTFTAARFHEEAFDRDDGSSQELSGEDVTDRLTYSHFSPRFRFSHEIGNFRYGAKLAATINQYDEDQAAADYSHHQFTGGIDSSYLLFGMTRVGIDGEYSVRNYEVYPARELDGTRFTLNPALEYIYTAAGVSIRQQVSRALFAVLDYHITQREDQYVGYDDYTRHTLRASAEFRLQRLRGSLAYSRRDYDFDNAFAFNTPAGGDKTLTSTFAELNLSYPLWRALSITALARMRLSESSDPRLEYDQSQFALGMRWAM